MEIVNIKSIVRKMRGGSQAQLVEGDDNCFYVAKFAGNPQGTRTLINEWIASQVMRRLGVCAPPLRVLRLSNELRKAENLCFRTGSITVPVRGALHLGSQVPVDPNKTTIFDFLPRKLLPQVTNIADFGVSFVVDKWLYQADKRQAIFIPEARHPSLRFRAHLIDQGMSFGGSRWELLDVPLHGLNMDSQVYSLLDMPTLFRSALADIEEITQADLCAMSKTLPDEWLGKDDRAALAILLNSLVARKVRLPDLLRRHWNAVQDSCSAISATEIPNRRPQIEARGSVRTDRKAR